MLSAIFETNNEWDMAIEHLYCRVQQSMGSNDGSQCFIESFKAAHSKNNGINTPDAVSKTFKSKSIPTSNYIWFDLDNLLISVPSAQPMSNIFRMSYFSKYLETYKCLSCHTGISK